MAEWDPVCWESWFGTTYAGVYHALSVCARIPARRVRGVVHVRGGEYRQLIICQRGTEL